MQRIPLWALLALLPQAAFAGSRHESYCTSAYDIAPTIEVCPDNRAFSEAADRCVNRFVNEVNATALRLRGNFARHQESSTSAQDSKQRNNNGNLVDSGNAFQQLLWNARLIRSDLQDYITTITLPGNPGLDLLMAYDIYDILAEDPCYHDNRVRLQAHIDWIEQKIGELERVDAMNHQLNQETVERVFALDGVPTSNPGAARLRYGQGSGKRTPSGKSSKSESTITGKIKHEELK